MRPSQISLPHVAVAFFLALAPSAPARAQQPLADPPSSKQFMGRFDFEMIANALAADDQRFSWDTHWVGSFDFVDYVRGRLTFLADYQAVLGSELQPFDPNQSKYTLEVSSSVRAGSTEVAGVLQHVSRHRGDRPKDFGVAINALSGRIMRQFDMGGGTLALRADAGKVIERSYVDYTWMAAMEAVVRRPMTPHVGVFARAYGEAFAVDSDIAGREHQRGGRVEGGVRLSGSRGAIELFGGYERVIDADQLDRLAREWAFGGFRLANN